MKNKKQFFRKPEASVKCSCGKVMVSRSRTNYPFGRGSKGITTKFHVCQNCGKRSN